MIWSEKRFPLFRIMRRNIVVQIASGARRDPMAETQLRKPAPRRVAPAPPAATKAVAL
jgi:hypothetical protein